MYTKKLESIETLKRNVTGNKPALEYKKDDAEKRKKNHQALQRILSEMEKQGYTIPDVCRKLGIRRQTFHMWIDRNSYININDFCEISRLLNVPMDTLYRGRELGNLKNLTTNQKKLIHIAYEHTGREIAVLFNTLSLMLRSGSDEPFSEDRGQDSDISVPEEEQE